MTANGSLIVSKITPKVTNGFWANFQETLRMGQGTNWWCSRFQRDFFDVPKIKAKVHTTGTGSLFLSWTTSSKGRQLRCLAVLLISPPKLRFSCSPASFPDLLHNVRQKEGKTILQISACCKKNAIPFFDVTTITDLCGKNKE